MSNFKSKSISWIAKATLCSSFLLTPALPALATSSVQAAPLTHSNTQNADFTVQAPKSVKIDPNKVQLLHLVIHNNSKQASAYTIKPLNVTTNKQLKMEYAQGKNEPNTLASVIPEQHVVIPAGKTKRVIYRVQNNQNNALLMGGLMIKNNKHSQIVPLTIQMGELPAFMAQATTANFAKGKIAALDVTYHTNSTLLDHASIDSKLVHNNHTVAETKTNGRSLAPNSDVNLSLTLSKKLQPGNYQIVTTFEGDTRPTTVNTPLKLDAKTIAPINKKLVNEQKAIPKKHHTLLWGVLAIVGAGVLGGSGTYAYYDVKRRRKQNKGTVDKYGKNDTTQIVQNPNNSNVPSMPNQPQSNVPQGQGQDSNQSIGTPEQPKAVHQSMWKKLFHKEPKLPQTESKINMPKPIEQEIVNVDQNGNPLDNGQQKQTQAQQIQETQGLRQGNQEQTAVKTRTKSRFFSKLFDNVKSKNKPMPKSFANPEQNNPTVIDQTPQPTTIIEPPAPNMQQPQSPQVSAQNTQTIITPQPKQDAQQTQPKPVQKSSALNSLNNLRKAAGLAPVNNNGRETPRKVDENTANNMSSAELSNFKPDYEKVPDVTVDENEKKVDPFVNEDTNNKDAKNSPSNSSNAEQQDTADDDKQSTDNSSTSSNSNDSKDDMLNNLNDLLK